MREQAPVPVTGTADSIALRSCRLATGSSPSLGPSHAGRLAGVLASPSPSRLELFRSNAIEPSRMKPCVALTTLLLRTGSSCGLGISHNLPATAPTRGERGPHMPRSSRIRPAFDQLH